MLDESGGLSRLLFLASFDLKVSRSLVCKRAADSSRVVVAEPWVYNEAGCSLIEDRPAIHYSVSPFFVLASCLSRFPEAYYRPRLPSLPFNCRSYLLAIQISNTTTISVKPTLVLIHGLWHTPNTYSKFTKSLRLAGYEVHVPRLPSMNEARPPNTDLVTDTESIRGYVESLVDAGRTVIAIMFSYGGQVGTNALYGLGLNSRIQRGEGLSGGVSHFIYMCAFALPEGGSMVSKVQEFGHEHLLPLAFDFADDQSCVSGDPKALIVGPGIDDTEMEAYVSLMVRCNGRSMY